MQRETDLARQLGERLVVVVVERRCPDGSPNDEEPEQLTGVRDGSDAHDRLVVPLEHQARHPHPHPRRPRDAGTGHDRLLFCTEPELGGPAVGNRHGALEASTGRPRPDLGTIERHRLLQRLRELEEQLVERERPRQPGAEGAEHLVRSVPFAVHAASREVGESLARRHPQQRGKCRREHGEAEE